MKSEPYSGPVSAMRNSAWLAAEDLDGIGEVEVTIESVYRHEDAVMEGGRIEKCMWALKFVGRDKQMILNATNRKALVASFSAKTSEWAGKKVKLYVADGIKKPGGRRGETTKGLRIRVPMTNRSISEAVAAEEAQQ
jgi:hypothetical protein